MKTATCLKCGIQDQVSNMNKVDSPNKNYFYTCHSCFVPNLQLSYSTYSQENTVFTKKQAKHGQTISIELETSNNNDDSTWLYQYGFLPTHDGSINGIEWKSPIWCNKSGLNQLFRTVEKKCEFDSQCGTHVNIGSFDSSSMDMIKRFYHSLFVPLCNHMSNNPVKTKKAFGRDFTYYASKITTNTEPTKHENFINTQHNTHLEFRLCKFNTADTFMDTLKMCSEMVATINSNFISHFNDHLTDTSINPQAHRKHKASITAQKLIKIFDKYAV